jgi:hypothetical protein
LFSRVIHTSGDSTFGDHARERDDCQSSRSGVEPAINFIALADRFTVPPKALLI